ncbi:MAG: DUF134 domain-containing protein [Ignavibacteria bacterium]
MPRPKKIRKVSCSPESSYYKPRGIPLRELEEVILTIDELEAITLTDIKKLYQEEAAAKMNISRQTLGRIVEKAHSKITEAILYGKAIKIEGGSYTLGRANNRKCRICKNNFVLTDKIIKSNNCPKCNKLKRIKN